MVYFVNELELSDEYQTNGTVKNENYKVKFLFPMKYFASFGKDFRSMYFMSIIFLKDEIDGVRVPQFQTCLHLRHNSSFTYKSWLSFVVEYIICDG